MSFVLEISLGNEEITLNNEKVTEADFVSDSLSKVPF